MDKVYKSSTSLFAVIRTNTSVSIQAHSITIQNTGTTTAKIDGFAPIVPNGFLIIDNYGSVNVYHDENFVIKFDATGVSSPVNNLIIYTQKIKGFPYSC